MVTITLLLKIILGSLNSKIIKSKWYNTERYKTLFIETMIIYIGNIKKTTEKCEDLYHSSPTLLDINSEKSNVPLHQLQSHRE